MYTIRAGQKPGMVAVELRQRVTTTEALRALTQVFALMEAGGLRAARVDVRGVERGPGGLLLLASAMATRRAPGQRIAFVAGPRQARLTARLARFSGLGPAVDMFDSLEDADAWLGEEQRGAQPDGPFADRPRPGQVLKGRLVGQKRRVTATAPAA